MDYSFISSLLVLKIKRCTFLPLFASSVGRVRVTQFCIHSAEFTQHTSVTTPRRLVIYLPGGLKIFLINLLKRSGKKNSHFWNVKSVRPLCISCLMYADVCRKRGGATRNFPLVISALPFVRQIFFMIYNVG